MNKAAINLIRQSEAARKRGDKSAAMKLVQASLKADDTLPGAWYNIGSDFHNNGDRKAAAAALRRCRELAGNEPYTLTNLGWNLQLLGDFDGALAALKEATELAPEKPLGWSNLSLAYNSLHMAQQAIATAQEAVRLAPEDPQHRMALAFALMMNGEWLEGLAEYEARFPYKMPEFLSYPMPRWDGSHVDHLFVPCEQGLGDTLQFLRFVALAAAKVGRLTLCVQEELYPLLEGAADFPLNADFEAMPAPVPAANAFCPLLSLPVALGLDDGGVPTVEPGSWLAQTYLGGHQVYGDRKKIGIIWAGSPDQENDHHRSASVGDFLGLYAAEGVQLYSFQVGDRAKECRSVAPLVIDLAPKIRDFTDTAALMLQMDAIVTVCTSTAHLAGVLGVPVHIVLPRHGQHFVWGHSGSTTPWYPSARLHRQERIGDWGPVIRGVAEALRTSSTASRSMILKPSFIRWELGI